MAELREERDVARKRLDDVQQALAAAQEVLSGQPLEPVLRTVIGRMAEAAGASHGSFLVIEPDRSLRVATRLGLNAEPLLRLPLGARIVTDRFLSETEPRLHQAADSLDLGDALDGSEPPFGGVVVVPVRTPLSLQGMAMIYLTPDDALPRAEALTHLSVISRGLAASLELARALETVRSAEKTLQLALSGTASVRGLQQIVTFLEELRDRQGEMRRRPGVPPWFLEEFARLSPSLSGALTTARSLLAFSRGEVHRESIAVEDLVAEMRGDAVAVHVGPGVTTVSGDPVLLRLAIASLVDHARGGVAASRDTPIQIRAVADGGRVRLSVIDPFASAPAARASGGGEVGLNLVRRIAELHGGTLTPNPEPGPGFRYTITLLPG
jgi:signal transduction histidine kinase